MSMQDSVGTRVFISHSSSDAKKAQAICSQLEEHGIACWIAPRNVSPGTAYGEEIIKAIESCGVLVLVLSSSSNTSNAVTSEVERAFSKNKPIIPIRIEDVVPARAIEFFVASAQWVDAYASPLSNAVDQVAAGIRQTTDQPGGDQQSIELPPAKRKVACSPRIIAGRIGLAIGLLVAACCGVWVLQRSDDSHTPVLGENGAPPATAILPRYHALVVGINDYMPHDGHGWSPLGTARSDAEAVADVLEKRFGFQVQKLLDRDATRAGVLNALDGLVSLGPNDALLVYFAGHGFFDEAVSEGYWIPADARKRDGGRLAKQDWIWNSSISTLLGACGARHVLLIADSCYAGSLFRGSTVGAEPTGLNWYRRAIQTPSRYLLASGNMEPVLDSGGKHSAFAQQVVNYLSDVNNSVFSASDIGLHVRSRVGELTGQMVRMGALKSQLHSGGEFVFVKSGASLGHGAMAPPPRELDADQVEPVAVERQMVSALALARGGATNAAGRVVQAVLDEDADSRLAVAVKSHLSEERKTESREALRMLIKAVEERSKSADATEDIRPRVIACLGFTTPPGSRISEDEIQLYHLCLQSEFEMLGRSVLVERDALESILEEMELGTSQLADDNARLEIGKLLPAGVLLVGSILPTGNEGEMLFVRIMDTETTEVIATVPGKRTASEDPYESAAQMAHTILSKIVSLKPIAAAASIDSNGQVMAEVGRFHGVQEGMMFDVQRRVPMEGGGPDDFRTKLIGQARVTSALRTQSILAVEWETTPLAPEARNFWVRERPLDSSL